MRARSAALGLTGAIIAFSAALAVVRRRNLAVYDPGAVPGRSAARPPSPQDTLNGAPPEESRQPRPPPLVQLLGTLKKDPGQGLATVLCLVGAHATPQTVIVAQSAAARLGGDVFIHSALEDLHVLARIKAKGVSLVASEDPLQASAHCFEDAIRHALRYRRPVYNVFIRMESREPSGSLPTVLPSFAGPDDSRVHWAASGAIALTRSGLHAMAMGFKQPQVAWNESAPAPAIRSVTPANSTRVGRLRLVMPSGHDFKALQPRGAPPPSGSALCLVGELRTFAVAAVHEGLRRLADDVGSDVFVHKHTRFRAKENGPFKHHATACKEDWAAMARVRPKAIFELEPIETQCPLSAAIQFHQVSHCFMEAARYASRHRAMAYKMFVRARPDLLVQVPVPMPDLGARDLRIHHSTPQRDFCFALHKGAMSRFLGLGGKQYAHCPKGPEGLENMAYYRRAAVPWPVVVGVLRAPVSNGLPAELSHVHHDIFPLLKVLKRNASALGCELIANRTADPRGLRGNVPVQRRRRSRLLRARRPRLGAQAAGFPMALPR